jgi:hypothetical protein
MMNGCVAETDAPSVTIAVKLNVPAIVGVPEMAPELAMLNPDGNAPLMVLQVKGGLSPVAVSAAE